MRIAALDIGGTSIKSGIWTGGLAEEVREEATEAKKGGPAVMAKAKDDISLLAIRNPEYAAEIKELTDLSEMGIEVP